MEYIGLYLGYSPKGTQLFPLIWPFSATSTLHCLFGHTFLETYSRPLQVRKRNNFEWQREKRKMKWEHDLFFFSGEIPTWLNCPQWWWFFGESDCNVTTTQVSPRGCYAWRIDDAWQYICLQSPTSKIYASWDVINGKLIDILSFTVHNTPCWNFWSWGNPISVTIIHFVCFYLKLLWHLKHLLPCPSRNLPLEQLLPSAVSPIHLTNVNGVTKRYATTWPTKKKPNPKSQ